MKTEAVITLFDDDSVKEKLTVMTKWEAMMNDARNETVLDGDKIDEFLQLGKTYKVTLIVEEFSNQILVE